MEVRDAAANLATRDKKTWFGEEYLTGKQD